MQKRTVLLVGTLIGFLLAALRGPSIRLPGNAQGEEGPWPWAAGSSGEVAHANSPAPRDTLSETAVLRRIERLYRLQANLVEAQAAGEAERIDRLLHAALEELGALAERPGLAGRPRFRRLFWALTSEYETRYGVPDTLWLPEGRIYRLRKTLSAALREDGESASVVDVLPAGLRSQNSEVPLSLNRHVEESLAFLLDHRDEYLRPWLRRASTYFPMIEQIFAEEGVPGELKYLALVESGLNPRARSHAQAAGMWQFMAQTARLYGLSIDPWIDERLDPEKSTRAAARHLKDLHEQFGDWQLAMAGYNYDPDRVQAIVREHRRRMGGSPSFWDVYRELPPETRSYVPLFTATALIFSNPTAFELGRLPAAPRYAFDYVPVGTPLKIERVARLAETDLQKIRVLNPELQAGRLPPSEEPYYVRLPLGAYSTFAANYAALPEEERSQEVHHELRSGEMAGRIAERYHVDRSALLEANGGGPPVTMHVGQHLTIPETTYAGNARLAESADGEPIRVRYGSRVVRSLGSKAPQADLTSITASSPAP